MNDREAVTLERALREQGFLLRPVEGDSMMPLLDQRTDLVKLVLPSEPLKAYDLPLYRRPNGALVLHRIIKVKPRYYVICGDNRQRYERVPHDWVIALAVGRYRGEDYLSFDNEEYLEQVRALCLAKDRFSKRFAAGAKRVFPPWGHMKKRYPLLTRCPFLLPLCYPAGWASAVVRKMKRKRL